MKTPKHEEIQQRGNKLDEQWASFYVKSQALHLFTYAGMGQNENEKRVPWTDYKQS